MVFGPLTHSRPPSAMPSTGSRRLAMPGIMRPTLPFLLNMGVFKDSTGAISVMP